MLGSPVGQGTGAIEGIVLKEEQSHGMGWK
jgi:hypothetical protein